MSSALAPAPKPKKPSLAMALEELQQLQTLLELSETEQQREALLNELAETAETVVRKVDGFRAFLARLDAEIALWKAEEKRLADGRKVKETLFERLKDYAVGVLAESNLKELDGDYGKIRRQANSQASVKIEKPELIPAGCCRVTLEMPADQWAALKRHIPSHVLEAGGWSEKSEPSTTAIKAAFERGEDVPGAALVFGEHLRWK